MLKLLVTVLRFVTRRGREEVCSPDRIGTLVAVELTRLGDFVSILPCLVALRRRFTRSRIIVIASASHASLVTLCNAGIEIISVPEPGTLRGLLRAARAVRRANPDLVCSMSPSNRNAFLALSSGAPFVAGYLSANSTVTPFLDVVPVETRGFPGMTSLAFSGEVIHERPWKVMQALGMQPPPEGRMEFSSPTDGYRAFERLLPGYPRRPYIIIHPFSGWTYRSWPVSRFVSLANRLPGALARDVLFIAHQSEREEFAALQRGLEGTQGVLFSLCGDIMDASSLIAGADLFIGNDSGPLHLAALLGVPVVGLFGPASPELTAPPAGMSEFLYSRVPCSPCRQRRCVMPADRCMERISVGEVLAAATRLLVDGGRETLAAHG